MEETTAITSSPPSATSNHVADANTTANSSKIREDGELSPPENDDFARSQLPDGTILPAAPLNRGTRVVEKGLSAPIHNPAVASRTIAHSNKRKGIEKNRVPFVISFSDDDDSGSDSEEYKKGSTMESDKRARDTVDNRKLSTSLVTSRTQMVQQTAKTNTKSPKKLSTGRTFVSSVNRVNGAKFKNGGSAFVGVKTHLKKSTPPSIIKFGQNVHINSNKLQDLRQLIAIRENELKSKAGKPDKEVASSSKKNSSDMNMKNIAAKSRNFTERVVVEPKEQETKRLKVSEPPRNVVAFVGQHDRPPSESTVAAGVAISVGQHDRPPSESTAATGVAISAGQHGRPPQESTVAAGVAISVGQHDRPPSESTAATGVAISAGQHGRPPSESTVAAGVAISVGQHDRPPSESTAATGVASSAGQHGRPPSESTVAAGVAISVGQHDRPPSESTAATAVAISAGQHGKPPSESAVAAGVAISVGQTDRPPSESTAAAGVKNSVCQHGTSALENDGLKGRYAGNYCDKEILGAPGQSRAIQQPIKEVKNHDIKNPLIGSGIISNDRQHNRIANLGESSAQLMAKTDKTSPPGQDPNELPLHINALELMPTLVT